MNTLIAYSSRTGNTKKVAEAIYAAVAGPAVLLEAGALPEDISMYDLVFAGFWADRGTADKEGADLLRRLRQKRVAVFATCGVYADSAHARDCLAHGAALLSEDCLLLGSWICQGKVDPQVIRMMAAMFPRGPHSMTQERVARLEEAKKHPDAEDLRRAGRWARGIQEGASV